MTKIKFAILLLSLSLTQFSYAGTGGNGGGPKADAKVTMKVCFNDHETGNTGCQEVEYGKNNFRDGIVTSCFLQTADGEVECPNKAKMPRTLIKWNEQLMEAGFLPNTTPPHMEPSNNR